MTKREPGTFSGSAKTGDSHVTPPLVVRSPRACAQLARASVGSIPSGCYETLTVIAIATAPPRSDPKARLRWRARKDGETVGQQRKAYRAEAWLTADHVNIVFACMSRSAAKGASSICTAWCEYDDHALADDAIKAALPRPNFEAIWRALAFMDYEKAKWGDDGELLNGAVYEHDDKGKAKLKRTDKIARVRWWVKAAEKNWSANWTAGQVVPVHAK